MRQGRPLLRSSDINRRQTLVFLACVPLGAVSDFFFVALVIGWAFNFVFNESWLFIYGPAYLAGAGTLWNFLLTSPWRQERRFGVYGYLLGALLSHFIFVNAHGTRLYSMNVDKKYNAGVQGVLLRSPDWPQVLFVTSEKAREELTRNFEDKSAPVTVSVTSDYGCYREAAVKTVAGVDVMYDHSATWTWQVNQLSKISGSYNPGEEDQRFFWCRRWSKKKDEGAPVWLRPWDQDDSGAKPGSKP